MTRSQRKHSARRQGENQDDEDEYGPIFDAFHNLVVNVEEHVPDVIKDALGISTDEEEKPVMSTEPSDQPPETEGSESSDSSLLDELQREVGFLRSVRTRCNVVTERLEREKLQLQEELDELKSRQTEASEPQPKPKRAKETRMADRRTNDEIKDAIRDLATRKSRDITMFNLDKMEKSNLLGFEQMLTAFPDATSSTQPSTGGSSSSASAGGSSAPAGTGSSTGGTTVTDTSGSSSSASRPKLNFNTIKMLTLPQALDHIEARGYEVDTEMVDNPAPKGEIVDAKMEGDKAKLSVSKGPTPKVVPEAEPSSIEATPETEDEPVTTPTATSEAKPADKAKEIGGGLLKGLKGLIGTSEDFKKGITS